MHRLTYTLAIALLIVGLASCAGSRKQQQSQAQSYQQMVERAYQNAEKNYESGNYPQAIRTYSNIKSKFPYSRYAALSELRIADAYFAQDQFATAVEQYRNFIQLHPKHEKRVYARFRIALAFYELMPDNFFLMPPAYERDLSKTEDAARELELFVENYPKSQYTKRARKLLAKARRRLADHEFYVAEFYLDRDNWRAAAMRLTYLLQNCSGLGLDAQALFLLAKSYLELGDVQRARDALADLITVHPDSEYAQRAKEYVSEYDLNLEIEQ